jgi:hypothetical protein
MVEPLAVYANHEWVGVVTTLDANKRLDGQIDLVVLCEDGVCRVTTVPAEQCHSHVGEWHRQNGEYIPF